MRTQRHHRRGQPSWPTAIPVVPAISDIAGTQRHLAVAGHCFSSGGRHHAWPVRAVLVSNQSGAVRRVLPMQLAATAHRSQPVPANVPPTGGLHNPVHPGMAEVRHPPQRRVHEHHRIAGRARHFGAIALAFDIKRIPWRTPLRILIASYWVSFGVGVVQWLSIRLHANR